MNNGAGKNLITRWINCASCFWVHSLNLFQSKKNNKKQWLYYLRSIQCIFQNLLLWGIKLKWNRSATAGSHRPIEIGISHETLQQESFVYVEMNELTELTYHCGPPPAASWVTVDDAVLSDPHCHLPKVIIHSLHGNTTEDTQAAWRENKNTDYWYIHRDALSVLLARW